MGIKNGTRIGASIAEWKNKNRPNSMVARVFSKLGGFIGSAMLIIAVLGMVAGSGMKNGPDFGSMLCMAIVGLVIDVGSHWVVLKIDKMFSSK